MSTGARVLAGYLRNASAVATWVQQSGKRITVVPAGEQWPDGLLRPAIEDWIGAGVIIRRLLGRLSPESQIAAVAFSQDPLLHCSSGRLLAEQGFARDVEIAAELDVSEVVPVLTDDVFVAM